MHLALVVIVFALVMHCQNGDCFCVFHFKQRNITTTPKSNHQLSQKRVYWRGLATTERKGLQNFHCLADHHPCAFCGGKIVLR